MYINLHAIFFIPLDPWIFSNSMYLSIYLCVYQADCDIRDYGKKVQQLEIGFDETNDKMIKATESLEEKEKMFKEVESDVAALSRYMLVGDNESVTVMCDVIKFRLKGK